MAVLLYESDCIWDGANHGKGQAGSDEIDETLGGLRLPQRQLQVLMTTRALHLRSHPGQASLPGGKVDASDGCVEETALRESEEEIGLRWRSSLGKSLFWLYTGEPCASLLEK